MTDLADMYKPPGGNAKTIGDVLHASPYGPFQGQLTPGNIDLDHRPMVRMPDGSIATVRSMSADFDGREVLMPTVSDNGRIMPDRQAIQQFQQTGRNLGTFDSPAHADAYAKALHEAQALFYRTGQQ